MSNEDGSPEPVSVNIAPGVTMLAVLRHLNYKPWFALAEFVDNAVQSMLSNLDELRAIDGPDYILRVDIAMSAGTNGHITISDNAAGIAVSEFPRAFRAAQVPPDSSGLSEFGMGMKSASCWFASSWTVKTKALGAGEGHSIHFDIARIIRDEIEELDITTFPSTPSSHGTEVILEGLHHPPIGRQITKIRQHLVDIYRVYIRNGQLRLTVNGEDLTFESPSVLEAPYFRDPDGEAQTWSKEIDFTMSGGQTVRGYAALREVGSTRANLGFSLFRRGRAILGTGDEGYKPSSIFAGGNSFRSQRVFGELHLNGFEVSHTKDGFQWAESEDEFLEKLRIELDADPLPLLRQAEGYRARTPPPDYDAIARAAIDNTVEALNRELPAVIEDQPEQADPEVHDAPDHLVDSPTAQERELEFVLDSGTWTISVQIERGIDSGSWLSRSIQDDDPAHTKIQVRLNATHPFMLRFADDDPESLESVLRIAVAIVVGEVLSRRAAIHGAGHVTKQIERVLSEALSGP